MSFWEYMAVFGMAVAYAMIIVMLLTAVNKYVTSGAGVFFWLTVILVGGLAALYWVIELQVSLLPGVSWNG